MYKSCYEIDIKLPDDYIDKAMKAFDERLPKAYKDRAPDAHIDEYPELFEILVKHRVFNYDTFEYNIKNIPDFGNLQAGTII